MTAIHDDKSADARTHALVIGVGHYTHLEGGGGPVAANTLGLGQLSSPPYSAVRLANWFLDDFCNDDAPLGSLELLVSPTPGTRPSPWPVEAATMANIE